MLKKRNNTGKLAATAVAAGLAGAAAGAAAVALSDKKNRDKATKALKEAADKGNRLIANSKKSLSNNVNEVKEAAANMKDKGNNPSKHARKVVKSKNK